MPVPLALQQSGMNRRLFLIPLLLLSVTLFAADRLPRLDLLKFRDASGQVQPREISTQSVAEFFDAAYITQKHAYSLVGLTVSVVHGGEVIFKKGYGFADLGERVAVDPDRHLFRIASITKTFTATAVMQLVEQGQLDLVRAHDARRSK